MSIPLVIATIGVVCGFAAIAVWVVMDMLSNKISARQADPHIPHSKSARPNPFVFLNPGVALAEAGRNEAPEIAHDIVSMTPTVGYKFFQVAICTLALATIWIPHNRPMSMGLELDLLISGIVAFLMIQVARYEASYNEKGLIAPNAFFQRKFYPWEELISVHAQSTWTYRIKFETGTVTLQKYLVGMPTFLTFVTEVKEMNRRR